MQAADTVAQNPNFTGPVKNQIVLARDVLQEKFAEHGLVTEALEEHLAAQYEQLNGVAIMRGWEERAWRQAPDEAETCPRCGVKRIVLDPLTGAPREVLNWKQKGAPHAESEAYPYFERRKFYEAQQSARGAKTIDMDPALAKERIEQFLNSPNPAEHAAQINELRTQVLGLPAIDFATDTIPAPIVTQGMTSAAAPATATDATTKESADPLDAKRANFLRMEWREQKAALAEETDTAFLGWVRKAKVIPAVRTAAKARSEALSKPKE